MSFSRLRPVISQSIHTNGSLDFVSGISNKAQFFEDTDRECVSLSDEHLLYFQQSDCTTFERSREKSMLLKVIGACGPQRLNVTTLLAFTIWHLRSFHNLQGYIVWFTDGKRWPDSCTDRYEQVCK